MHFFVAVTVLEKTRSHQKILSGTITINGKTGIMNYITFCPFERDIFYTYLRH